MTDPISLIKENPLLPAEDYVALRKEGFKQIEETGSDYWTDYNNSDPGITVLEAVSYAITDLAYRTGFEIKDLLAPEKLNKETWNEIFYTARKILHNGPLTINDYRKLIIDVEGVRNAWIQKSKDYEVPVWVDYNYPHFSNDHDCSCEGKEKNICYGILGLDPMLKPDEYKNHFERPDDDISEGDFGLLKDEIPDDPKNLLPSKIVEFEGLYNIMIEYEEDIASDDEKAEEARQRVMDRLAHNRNLCEDFLSVNAIEYEEMGIGLFAVLEEYADPDVVLAKVFFTIYKYFTPSIPFHTIQEMMDMGRTIDEIFEGPALKRGFIDSEELEKTDLYRDIRLSDIINEISDIEGMKAITYLHLPFAGIEDDSSDRSFFDNWIKKLREEKKIAKIIPERSQVMLCKERDLITYYLNKPEDRRPDRMKKLFTDFKNIDNKYKLSGHLKDFPVPTGENMNLEDYYPVTYSLPMCYGVSERAGLPADADEKRKVQALQLKGYLQFFEQLLAGHLTQLNHLRDLFSFSADIQHNSFTRSLYTVTEYNEVQLSEINDLRSLLIDHGNRGDGNWDQILKDFTAVLQNLLESPERFTKRRNRFLDHMLARFSEDMSEYESISRWLTPENFGKRMMKDKIHILEKGEYYHISTTRGMGYNYMESPDHDRPNISGAERRVSRLLGFSGLNSSILSTELSSEYIHVEINEDGKNIISLLDPDNKKTVLLTSVEVKGDCCTESLITQILYHADERRYFIFYNANKKRKSKYAESTGPFWFELYDGTNPETAVLLGCSKHFDAEKDCQHSFMQLKKLMEKINSNEGIHLVEHLLLRPRSDEVLKKNNDPETVLFLNICLDKCDLGIGLGENVDTPLYKKKIHRVPADKCYDKMPWILEYFHYDDVVQTTSILYREAFEDGAPALPLKFRRYESLAKRVFDLQEFGSQKSNYEIIPNDNRNNTLYSFKIIGDNNECLAQSDFKYTLRINPGDVQGENDIEIEIEKFTRYFGFELDLYCEENPCDNNEDPYSFRVTAILPCWPKRFRDPTFRNLVEKTIQTEFPAHIHTRVVWVGLQEMREFEKVHNHWKKEMRQTGMPKYETVNKLVDKLNTIKACGSCDEDCNDN